MAKFLVQSIEERTDGDVACDTYVLKDDDSVISHFTVIIRAADVLAMAGWQTAQRVAGYKALFAADPRIAGVTDSEAAVSQMKTDVVFPVTVTV